MPDVKLNYFNASSSMHIFNISAYQSKINSLKKLNEGRKEMFYLTMHSTHFIYGYMASDIWFKDHSDSKKGNPLPPPLFFLIIARVLLYAPSHRQDSTYHGLCYTSRGELAGMRNSSMGPPHEGSIWWPIAPWANALTMEPTYDKCQMWN